MSNVTWTNVTYHNVTPYKRNVGNTAQCHWSPTVPEATRQDWTCPDLSGGWENKNTICGWMMALNLRYNNLSHLVVLKMLWYDVQMHRSVPVTRHKKDKQSLAYFKCKRFIDIVFFCIITCLYVETYIQMWIFLCSNNIYNHNKTVYNVIICNCLYLVLKCEFTL